MVEEVGVPPAFDPLAQAAGQRARQEIGEREQPTLAGVQDIQVLDRLVQLAILGVAEPIAVRALEQHADEGVQEVQVLRRRVQRERD